MYKNAISLNKIPKLEKRFNRIIWYVKYYFPNFKIPKVYVFSWLQNCTKNLFCTFQNKKIIFIDLSAFMGEKSEYYEGIDNYIKRYDLKM